MLWSLMEWSMLTLAVAVMVGATSVQGAVPQPPEVTPVKWLSPQHHPRAITTAEQLEQLRASVAGSDWRQAYLDHQKRVVQPVMQMSDDELRALVPEANSLFVYGLGMNLDPVHHQRMRWGGWNRPHQVLDVKGNTYPNEDWPDAGQGVKHPQSGKMYYFVAQANGHIIKQLELRVLPALMDIWAMTGSQAHAHKAAVLMDAVAAVYPTNRRGPMDYPTASSDMDRGGRLDRPYYQVARGLMNYVYVADLLAASGALEAPSAYGNFSMREHIARNLLWDGAAYCYDFAQRGYSLHNGQIDYARGAAYVGVVLDEPMLAAPMLKGDMRFSVMLNNNIDENGFYYETSPTYANHTRELYITAAEMIHAMQRLDWPGVESAYDDPSLRRFLAEPFNRAEVGGHVPLIGDAGPDRAVIDPLRRLPVPPRVYTDSLLDGQIDAAWVCLVRGVNEDAAAKLLRDSYGDQPVAPPHTRWAIYNITDEHLARIAQIQPNDQRFETDSVFYGGKGLALLRGGKGSHRHGVQLFFGPVHNHGQDESLTWTFFARGAEWSLDPGYYNKQFRMGWTTPTVSHQALVVNEQSVSSRQGSGQLLAWHDDSQVQWAMASHDAAYHEQGVTRYERLIAQVQRTSDGELAYWLDIGIVAGGKIRDDSFHTQMKQVKLDTPLSEPFAPAMYGDIDYGRRLLADMTLEGHADKGFYWAPPGDGYAFLGSPQRAVGDRTVRAHFTSPAFFKDGDAEPTMIVDFAGAEGRELIVAAGPEMPSHNHPPVPHVIRRDRGDGVSMFAKLIRLTDDEASDPVASFETISLDHANAGAWLVTWKDGRRDLWIVNEPGREITVHPTALPTIQADGRVTLLRFNKQGNVTRIDASEATFVAIDGKPMVQGQAKVEGRATRIDPAATSATFDVAWANLNDNAAAEVRGGLMRTVGVHGAHTSWMVDAVAGDSVAVQGANLLIGSTRLEPVAGKPGWYRLASSVSRFMSRAGLSNTGYAAGRPVFVAGQCVGRIVELSKDAKQVRLALQNKSLEGKLMDAAVLLVGPGDRVILPLTLRWRAEAEVNE